MMKHIWLLTVAGGAALMPAFASAQDAAGDRDWSGVEQCASIGEAHARHTCLDEALAAMGLLAPGAAMAPPERPAPQSGPGQPAYQPRAEAPAGAAPSSAAPADTRQRAPAPMAEAGTTTTIRSARLIGRRNIEIETAEGQRWRSTSSETFRRTPRAGAPFHVEPGALGSYNCRIERSTVFKCEPVS